MKIATHDKGALIHWAGAQKRSPAIRDGAPVLLGHDQSDPKAVRCGWAPFFEALHAARVVLVYDTDAPDSGGLLPAAEAKGLPGGERPLGAQIKHALGFLRMFGSSGAKPPDKPA
jgi:hypothetical protein